MKLGVLTVALGDMSLDAACKFLSEQGVQMVEIGCGGFLNGALQRGRASGG